ncbi:hypothetical protein Ciccas_004262 [Cichlidogyrus casuarinus]|uniref:Uncharacterized protein n=1 Tax=Cichlidogyrus casuarinus TaxID=1844966 RepID=A0ABD2QEC2_9PLAT
MFGFHHSNRVKLIYILLNSLCCEGAVKQNKSANANKVRIFCRFNSSGVVADPVVSGKEDARLWLEIAMDASCERVRSEGPPTLYCLPDGMMKHFVGVLRILYQLELLHISSGNTDLAMKPHLADLNCKLHEDLSEFSELICASLVLLLGSLATVALILSLDYAKISWSGPN